MIVRIAFFLKFLLNIICLACWITCAVSAFILSIFSIYFIMYLFIFMHILLLSYYLWCQWGGRCDVDREPWVVKRRWSEATTGSVVWRPVGMRRAAAVREWWGRLDWSEALLRGGFAVSQRSSRECQRVAASKAMIRRRVGGASDAMEVRGCGSVSGEDIRRRV